jgi:hypothetical protein
VTWATLAIGTQIANALAWMGVCLHFLPSTWRILMKRGQLWDAAGAGSFIVGCVMSSYMFRWVAAGAKVVVAMPFLPWWTVTNIASIAAAAGALMHFEVLEAQRANERSRFALMMWAAFVMSCILLAVFLG